MHRWIRLKLDVAYRISACGRQKPTGIPAIEARFRVLDRLIQDVEACESEATRWRATRKATITARDRLRVEIWNPLLRHITDIAAVTGESVIGLTGRFTLPPFRIGELEFAIAARRIANQAILEYETLRPYGLMKGAAVELLTQLGEWKALDRKAVECRLRHVAARAGLKARTDEMMQEITVLGILYRTEFRSDPARLAAWRSARKVAWPAHKRAGSSREVSV